MQEQDFPWRNAKPLAQVLAESRQFLESRRIIEPGPGSSESEIAAVEKRIGRPLPAEVREFHLRVRPIPVFQNYEKRDFGFYRLSDREFAWLSMAQAEPPEDWIRADGLQIGQSVFGDPFWWIRGHRKFPDGCIVLLDHDGGMGDLPFVRFAKNLAEFIAKVTFFEWLGQVSGSDENGRIKRDLFLKDYAALNKPE